MVREDQLWNGTGKLVREYSVAPCTSANDIAATIVAWYEFLSSCTTARLCGGDVGSTSASKAARAGTEQASSGLTGARSSLFCTPEACISEVQAQVKAIGIVERSTGTQEATQGRAGVQVEAPVQVKVPVQEHEGHLEATVSAEESQATVIAGTSHVLEVIWKRL